MSNSSLSSYVPSKLYGKRLVPNVIDEVARTDPDRVCFILPVADETYKQGQRTISYARMAQAIDRAAWFLAKELGPSITACETLAYIGPNDLRYYTLPVAAIKAGYKLLLPSPRNSAADQLHLLETTQCRTFLRSKFTQIDHITSAFTTGALKVVEVPELDYMLTAKDDEVLPFPYSLTYERAWKQPAVVLHSSGSTGQVNPIIHKHSSWATVDNHHLLPQDSDSIPALLSLPPGTPNLLAMPYFHAAGLLSGLLLNVFYDYPGILLPPACPISTSLIMETMECLKPGLAVLAPSMLEELAMSPRGLELLSHCLQVQYGGGSLATHAGEVVAKYTQLQSILGTTEAAILPTYVLNDGLHDHQYLRFNPRQPGIEFRPQDSGIYELVLVRHSGPDFFCIFETFPELQEYRTKDLFRPHPNKPGLWKHVGRIDDLVVLSNAEKVVPSVLQNLLQRAPMVKDVVIVGQNRFAVAAIIELNEGAQSLEETLIRAQLKPYIERANKDVPGHAKLSSDMVIFTTETKPMTRVGKGTVSRHATIRNYENEIEALYSGDESTVPVKDNALVNGVSEATTVQGLLELFATITSYSDLTATQDFLSLGIDSIQIFALVRHLRAQLRAEKASIPLETIRASLIYSNSTVVKLSQALHELASGGDNALSTGLTIEQRVERMQNILNRYVNSLPISTPREGRISQASLKNDVEVVILTGSTGSLGSYLLYWLVARSSFRKIICLNRSVDSRTKQMEAFKARDLSTKGWEERVEFLHADMSRPLFGLEEADYSRIAESLSLILHTQWPVNFNLPLSSFEPHIQSVRNLIDLAASAPLHPVLLFTSSIAATQNWTILHPTEPIPETLITDPKVSVGSGYGESKWIAECLLSAAAKISKVDARVVRLGQLAGSVDSPSIWNKDEWFPSLVVSSSYLSTIPAAIDAMPLADFVPVDRAARILIELGVYKTSPDVQDDIRLFNLVNPQPVFLSSILATIASSLTPPLRSVPYQEWLLALKEISEQASVNLSTHPAVKLMDFFEQMGTSAEAEESQSDMRSHYITAHIQEQSSEIRDLETWKASWVHHWLRGWNLVN